MNEISPTAQPAPSRRTRYSLEFKLRLVHASFAPGASIARLVREHGLNANQLFNWRYQYRKGQLGPASPSPLLLPVDIIDAMAVPATTSPTPQTATRSTRWPICCRGILSWTPPPASHCLCGNFSVNTVHSTRKDGIARAVTSHLRWWAEKIGKAGVLPMANAQLGVAERRYVTNISKTRELGSALDQITDVHVRMSLQLQAAFGLRREESIKFQPSYADRGDHLALKGSWTKGGRARTVPITTPEQHKVLRAAHRLAGAGSMIPAHKSYIQQRHVYDGQCKAAGLSNMHGLRHRYAQVRYEALTGWAASAAGGPPRHALSAEQRELDTHARRTISRELGHDRPQITSVYCGR